MHRVSFFFVSIVLALTMGCSPAAAPAPTAAPSKPTQAPPAANPTTAPVVAQPTQAKPVAAANKLDEYYQRAKASGELKIVQYGGGLGPEYEPMAAAFRQKYPGTEVELVSLRGPELIQRLTAEASSGGEMLSA